MVKFQAPRSYNVPKFLENYNFPDSVLYSNEVWSITVFWAIKDYEIFFLYHQGNFQYQ